MIVQLHLHMGQHMKQTRTMLYGYTNDIIIQDGILIPISIWFIFFNNVYLFCSLINQYQAGSNGGHIVFIYATHICDSELKP